MTIKKITPILLFITGVVMTGLSFLNGKPDSDDLTLKIKPATYIMPAAYKVYSNPNIMGGRFNLFKAIMKNESSRTISNLKVEYRIPRYIDNWTEADAPKYILPGQSIVSIAYPSLDQSITQKNTQSREKVEIRITYGDKGNPVEVLESFNFTMMAIQDFAFTDMPASEIVSWDDMMENHPLAACFVTAEDPVIQYYTSQIQQKLLQGETAGVTNTEREGLRFMLGIYEATLRSGMVYSSAPCIPTNTGEISTTVQRVRLPREVVSGNTGLCLELSLLYASIMRNAGMNPVIFFVPGHAFPGFRVNGNYYAIEATMIGGAGMEGGIASSEQALETGMKELADFIQAVRQGAERYYVIDINELYREGIIPMELRDDTFSKQKIDEYSANWMGPSGGRSSSAGNNSSAGRSSSRGSGSGANTPGMSTFNRGVTFSYPSSWNVMTNPYPQIPVLRSLVMSPQGAVEVYQLDGLNDVGEAMNRLRQIYASTGISISYQSTGSHNGYTLISGVSTNVAGQQVGWYGAFKTKGNAVVGVVVPATIREGQQILSSVR